MKNIEVFLKVAKEAPIARGIESTYNALNFGIPRALNNRALQGKKNSDVPGTTHAEKQVLSKIKKDKSGSHLIARGLTHPIGTFLASGGADVPAKILTAAVYYGARDAHNRSLLARAKDNKKVIGGRSNDFIQQIRKSK